MRNLPSSCQGKEARTSVSASMHISQTMRVSFTISGISCVLPLRQCLRILAKLSKINCPRQYNLCECFQRQCFHVA